MWIQCLKIYIKFIDGSEDTLTHVSGSKFPLKYAVHTTYLEIKDNDEALHILPFCSVIIFRIK